MAKRVKKSGGKRRVGDGTPGPGRPKGKPNKFTGAAKEAFAMAFDGLGGVEALIAWAESNPTDFYRLYARLIPVTLMGRFEHAHTVEEKTDEELLHIACGRGDGTAAPPRGPSKPSGVH